MTKESKQEEDFVSDISAKPDATVIMITDSIFNAIEWEKHYSVKERQALNDVVDEIISTTLTAQKEKMLGEEREKWIKAVVEQPPIFLKNNIVDLIESDHYRVVRRVRCVEILREMGEIEEADKLLKETRALKALDDLKRRVEEKL